MTGAARMAARAAARAGAGLTTIAVPEIALPIYAAALTSIMVRPLAAPEDFDHLLDDRRISAFLIGPGAGVGEETRARALAMLATGARRCSTRMRSLPFKTILRRSIGQSSAPVS
jgi:NAD(P)H-hydrate repair Nnr-like enzyme with NAD(P)H-hydrate dehydratase domain